jgi:sugar/nucleoside kinase (ribokinase family)
LICLGTCQGKAGTVITEAARRDVDVVVVAEINPDIVVMGDALGPVWGQAETVVDTIRLAIGSSSAIFACAAARLGLRTAVVGVVGDDVFGSFMLEALGDRGVDIGEVAIVPDTPTGASVILSRGDDRAILTAIGTIDALDAKAVPRSLLARSRHLHVGSLFMRPKLRQDLAALLTDARQSRLSVSVDPNWDPTGQWDIASDRLLGSVDLFLPNSGELRAIAGTDNDETGVEALLAEAGAAGNGRLTVAVKQGSAGGFARRGDQIERVSTAPVDVVDTTGAGDAFDAGMVYGMLGGWSLHESLELAVACGTLSVAAIGGTESQPGLDEALELLRIMRADRIGS